MNKLCALVLLVGLLPWAHACMIPFDIHGIQAAPHQAPRLRRSAHADVAVIELPTFRIFFGMFITVILAGLHKLL